ncbi:Rrf2 family transcriptional regulator [Sphingomonas sanguinis]|uniref:Rrf2 family transcriptional regulator n=1 Tax=Sphingomonas sanguinis TaxID=33051 RepID=UPI001C5A1B3A|nr:Rrf2 family transcriptional regulator [Sphingomonas sanguinis]QXT34219.1 Rrf2 family transcriptional regulator [Sphingomonas sanguinis]
MPTSTRFVVSLHMLALMAEHGDTPLRSEDIAVSVNSNAAVVRALLLRLAAAGLTRSQLGNRGGAMLAKPSSGIRLVDVYQAVEDRNFFAFHRQPPEGEGMIDRHITSSLESILTPVREALEEKLAGLTLDDVLDDIRARAGVETLESDEFQIDRARVGKQRREAVA